MAGDFVMVQFATPRKPEVLRMAGALGVPPAHAFGLCVIAWMWFDEQSEDGHVLGVTPVTLDAVVGHTGFSDALHQVGWLNVREGALQLPNFDRIMGESAKKRAKDAKRQQKHRHKSVTNVSQNPRDKSVTKEEKRREENIDTSNDVSMEKTPRPKFEPPSVEDVRAYCTERESKIDPQSFVDFYASKGWKVGSEKMVDWRAAVRNWERNDAKGTIGSRQSSTPRVGAGQRFRG